MRHDNPELQVGDGTSSTPVFGRSLLQTVEVTSSVSEVRLTLPVSPWKRFQIEIDNWGSVVDKKFARAALGMNGATRIGASDYSFAIHMFSHTADPGTDRSNASTFVWLTRDNDDWGFGDGTNELYSFDISLYPGEDATALPKFWWTGAGLADNAEGMGFTGSGVYRGVTSNEFGRAEYIEFTMEGDSNISRGTFRLYGTE
jgi:hypothetical protein